MEIQHVSCTVVGSFFERLIGMMKITLSKAVGQALLTFEELEEVLLDVETQPKSLAEIGFQSKI